MNIMAWMSLWFPPGGASHAYNVYATLCSTFAVPAADQYDSGKRVPRGHRPDGAGLR
ncbi:hypothetical protein [Ralstonia syzygii]|uniref:hypothetical protein n=1 Tax=Ralstonia syzygii TaxID=28097 RepID=UPI0018D0E12F|nr:hypothetical protein [Ralstonia syzygii]